MADRPTLKQAVILTASVGILTLVTCAQLSVSHSPSARWLPGGVLFASVAALAVTIFASKATPTERVVMIVVSLLLIGLNFASLIFWTI
jgi:hypothetical protein